MKNSLKYAAVFAIVLFSSSVVYVPPAQAYGYELWKIYYDASQAEAGWWHRSCNLQFSQDGAQDGVWKEEVENHCGPPVDQIVRYYHNCGGDWVEVGYIGDTSC